MFSSTATRGRKRLDGLELEARHLDDADAARRRRRRAHRLDQRHAQVAAHERRPPGRAQHLAGQRGGRRLAVGAGDRDERRRDEARRQLDLAGDRARPPRAPPPARGARARPATARSGRRR